MCSDYLRWYFRCDFSDWGWRLGLQAVTGAVFVTFLLGTCYRSASLYHPQRRAILHLKNQKRKVKDKKTANKVVKPVNKVSFWSISVSWMRTCRAIFQQPLTSDSWTIVMPQPLVCLSQSLCSDWDLLLRMFTVGGQAAVFRPDHAEVTNGSDPPAVNITVSFWTEHAAHLYREFVAGFASMSIISWIIQSRSFSLKTLLVHVVSLTVARLFYFCDLLLSDMMTSFICVSVQYTSNRSFFSCMSPWALQGCHG